MHGQIAMTPKAVPVILRHWQEREFTVMFCPKPPMIDDCILRQIQKRKCMLCTVLP